MTAYEFQGNALFHSDWFRSQANDDDDAINHNQPTLPDDNKFELPLRFNAHAFYTKVQHCRYLCGACGENVLEHNLTDHNASEHPGTPFIIEMYELFEVDECFKCELCDLEQFEADLTKHLTECHRQEIINYYYFAPENTPSPPPPPPPPRPLLPLMPFDSEIDNRQLPIVGNEVMKVPGHFLCLVCGVSSIRGRNLPIHRKKLHANIPHRVNIFSQQPDRSKFKCDVCQKWLFEKNIEKHCHKYHPDKYGDGKQSLGISATAAAAATASTGGITTTTTTTTASSVPETDDFLNVRISASEFQRLQSQNRIYEFNGMKYLKDSE